MYDPRNFPILIFLLSFTGLWFSAKIGAIVQNSQRDLVEDDRKDLNTVQAATLTLLGLIIAFSFSMAVSRYDQRKNLEAEEANAIGTEYVRASLLPPEKAEKVQQGLRAYLHQRILFYETRGFRESRLKQIETDTVRVETELWSSVQGVAAVQPAPTIALVVSGLNDVLNSRGYTQAAWWNRIPSAAWSLMALIAVFCSFLTGYSVHRSCTLTLLVVPLAVSIAFFLIADIDSPHGGLIHVLPQNLVYLSSSLGN